VHLIVILLQCHRFGIHSNSKLRLRGRRRKINAFRVKEVEKHAQRSDFSGNRTYSLSDAWQATVEKVSPGETLFRWGRVYFPPPETLYQYELAPGRIYTGTDPPPETFRPDRRRVYFAAPANPHSSIHSKHSSVITQCCWGKAGTDHSRATPRFLLQPWTKECATLPLGQTVRVIVVLFWYKNLEKTMHKPCRIFS